MVGQGDLRIQFKIRVDNVLQADRDPRIRSNLRYLINFIYNNPLLNNIYKELSSFVTKIPDLEERLDGLKIPNSVWKIE